MADPLDTIMAPATPVGTSALAMVRIDGPMVPEILAKLAPASEFVHRCATFSRLLDQQQRVFEEAVITRYAAPHSPTGNDLAEITLHGSALMIRSTLARLAELGARHAEAGEFTERGVLNGKLDLVQAEAVAELVNARTSAQARLSLRNLRGELSGAATRLRGGLLSIISRLEGALDFSDEGYEFITRNDARTGICEIVDELKALECTFEKGRVTSSGVSAVILGKPNAGKSSLLNYLCGSERAIVSSEAGTTRDLVRETVLLGGLPVTFTDTAGLRAAESEVESIGIERARAAGQSADLVLYLIDTSSGRDAFDDDELERFPNALIVRTRADLSPKDPEGELAISLTEGWNLDLLLEKLDSLVRARFLPPEESPTVVNERQRLAVSQASCALLAALTTIDEEASEEMILVDLYRASQELAMLTGGISSSDVYREIFQNFCIGK